MARGSAWSTFERACLAVVALAFALRFAALGTRLHVWDAAWFLTMARSFAETGTFVLPWSIPGQDPYYAQYFPPLFPIVASVLARAVDGYPAILLASFATGALATGVAWWTTRDLLDRERAFAVAALVATTPLLLGSELKGMSEPLLAALYALAAWALVKSRGRPAFALLAVPFLALALLAKASVGALVALAGAVAVAAALLLDRAARRSPWTLAAAAALVLPAAAWALLGGLREGGKTLGLGISAMEPLRALARDPLALVAVPAKLAFLAALLALFTLPLLASGALARAKASASGRVMLGTALAPLLVAAPFTAAFYLDEGRAFFDFDNLRYVAPAIVPLLWILLASPFPAAEPRVRAPVARRRRALYAAAVAACAVAIALNPLQILVTGARAALALALFGAAIGLALAALASGYAVSERSTTTGVEMRATRAKADGRAVAGVVLVGVALVLAALLLGAQFAAPLAAGGVALAGRGARERVLAAAVLFALVAGSGVYAYAPFEEIADRAAACAPEGGAVQVSWAAAPYYAAVMPREHPRLLPLGERDARAEVLVAFDPVDGLAFANYTRVDEHAFEVGALPVTMPLLAFERAAGTLPEQRVVAAALFAREGTPCA